MQHSAEKLKEREVLEKRIALALKHKEAAIEQELRWGTPERVAVVESGYNDLIQSLMKQSNNYLFGCMQSQS